MPKIILFAKSKGGVGASTLAVSMYFSFKSYSQNLKVCIVDLDPQGSILALKQKNDDIEAFDKYDETKLKNYDVIIVDSPPRITEAFTDLYKKAAVLIVPSKTAFFDIAETFKTCNYLKDEGHENKTFVVLNQATTNSSLNQQFTDTLDQYSIKYFNTVICNRLAFHRMQYENGNIFAQKGQAKAHEEIKSFSMEVYSLLIK